MRCWKGSGTARFCARTAGRVSAVWFGNPVKQEESSQNRPDPPLDSEGGKLSLARVNALHQDLKTLVNGQAKGVSTRHL